MARHEAPEGMRPIGEILAPIIEHINPHRTTPIYQVVGNRILNRLGHPVWMTIEQAEAEGLRLAAQLVKATDPGQVLPLIRDLAWAIRDAREAETDPTPPPANASASVDLEDAA